MIRLLVATLAATALAGAPVAVADPQDLEPECSGQVAQAGECTPGPIVARLHGELVAAMTKSPEMVEWLRAAGGVYDTLSQPEFAEMYRREVLKWRKLSADTGIRVEQ